MLAFFIKYAVQLLEKPSLNFWKLFIDKIDKFKENEQLSLEDATFLKVDIYSKKYAKQFFKNNIDFVDNLSTKDFLELVKNEHFKQLSEENKCVDDKFRKLMKRDILIERKRCKKKSKLFAFISTTPHILIFISTVVCVIHNLIGIYSGNNLKSNLIISLIFLLAEVLVQILPIKMVFLKVKYVYIKKYTKYFFNYYRVGCNNLKKISE